ncbi:RidA family protein [Inquilinus sp. CAU 1745]|uniref:RidA family protein n=1 Tax=Inquilinus sp. CAU 1745 TaxID=3140369 RepID=UPI00325AD181
MSIERLDSGPRMSQAVIHNGTVFLAGQVGDDPKADLAEQTRQILANIDALLARAGTDKSKLLTCNIWLADIAGFNEMNAVYDRWIDPANPPVRACVESALATPDYKVEIQVTAAL